MNKANGPVDRIKIGLGIALLVALTGCVGYVGGGYRGAVVVPGRDVYSLGGSHERGRDVRDYGWRGVESRAVAHPLIRHRRSWFSRDEISISFPKAASVHIKTGLIWEDILIESSGASDPLAGHGHRKVDARRIRELVETAQGSLTGGMEQESKS
jgi:hypothetical protein